jgi:hypothetical protein
MGGFVSWYNSKKIQAAVHRIQNDTLVPVIGINLGRPKKEIPEEWIDIKKQEYDRFRLNALYMEKNMQ